MEISRDRGINTRRIGYSMNISVVCANHGRDVTNLISSCMKSTVKPLDIHIIDRGFERSKQRNMGIEECKGDAILILDSDQSISETLIEECIDIVSKSYTCVYIPEVIIADSFFGKIRKFERGFYTGTAVDVPRFVLKSHCPMFDETMAGPEDADWGRRIKGKRAISKSVLYHHDDIGLLEYLRKKAYYSKSMGIYSEKNPDDKCLDIKYRCFTVFTEKGKWKKIIRHPILSIGIVFILFLRGVIYYAHK